MDDDLPLQVRRYFEDWAEYDKNLKNDYIEYAVIMSEFVVKNRTLLSSLALWKEITERDYPFDWSKINVKTKKID